MHFQLQGPMKNDLLFRRTAAVAVAILVLTTLTAFAQTSPREVAQTNAEKAREAARQAQKAAAEAAGARRGSFDINIASGMLDRNGNMEPASLDKVIDVVRERHPAANIVLSPRLPAIVIENLKLRTTDVEQELEALRVASGYRFAW